MLWGAAVLALAGLCCARIALADAPLVVELDYDRSAALDTCPDQAAFRRAVIERLGRDPFVVGAARKVHVQLTGNGSRWTARVRIEEAGVLRGEREIDARAGCQELAAGAALAVSIAIDPRVVLAAPVQSDQPPPALEPQAESPRVSPAPHQKLSTPKKPLAALVEAHWFASGAARAWVGAVPALSAGPSLGFGYGRGRWSLALQGFVVLARSQAAPDNGAVSASLWGAELAPCAESAGFRGCALFASGALLARGRGVDEPRTERAWHATAGLGVGYSFSSGRLSFTPSLQTSVRLKSALLTLDEHTVWTTPRFLGCLQLELGYTLL